MTQPMPFDVAVADYVASLNDEKKHAIHDRVPIPRSEESWPWFAEVIDRYHLRDKDSPVVRDINERIDPDPYGINNMLWSEGRNEPLYEAMVFLNAVRAVLSSPLGV